MRFKHVILPLSVAVVFATVAALGSSSARASGGLWQPRPRYDLFYNYYAAGAQPAEMYISPRPTPPFVGHTYITYQPLLPHEYLYKHHRVYERFNITDCGATKTRVCWW